MIYYWESKNGNGQFEAASDNDAILHWKPHWWVLYRESDTPDGTPFLIVKER